MLDAADALDTDVLAAILQRCVKHGEAARIDNAEYLRVLGVPGAQTAGEVWRALATMSQGETRVAPRSARCDSRRRYVGDAGCCGRSVRT